MILILKMTVFKRTCDAWPITMKRIKRSDYVTKISRYYDVIAVMPIGD